MTDAWYADGLAFRCTRCGNCCTGAPGHVWVNDKEVEEIAELLMSRWPRWKPLYTRWVGQRRSLREKANNDCVFCDREAGCTIYAVLAAPVPHLAVLGEQRRHAQRLGSNAARFARSRPGRIDLRRGDHTPAAP